MNFRKMESWNQRGLWVLIFSLIFQSCNGFYLSKSYPIYYTDELWVKLNHVNSLISNDREIPFSYYTLPFCEPQGGVEYSAGSLGKFITGYRVENSPYRFKVYTNESDIFLCQVESLARDKFNLLKKSIDEMYQVNLILDNLPAIGLIQKEGNFLRRKGYTAGFKVDDVYYLFNHLKFNVLVHKYEEVDESSEKPGYMVVGFEVIPCSVKHNVDSMKDLKMYSKYPSRVKCDPTTVAMPIKEGQRIVFTYEVTFEESDIKWASRWDAYLKAEGAKVNWFFVLNLLMVITFLLGIILWIIFSFVSDFTRYVELDKVVQTQMNEESYDWRHVLAHVFYTPSNPSWLCVMVGNGVQILGMATVSLIFVALGFMSPVSCRTLIMGMFLFYMILSMAAGYVSIRLWRTISQKGWISIALKTSCFFSFSFSMLTFLHFIFWGIPSSVSFIVIPALVWFCVSLPLTLVGGYFGAKEPLIQIPNQSNAYPCNIPNPVGPSWWVAPIIGIWPFTIIFEELLLVIPILTTSHVYYGIGFLFVVLINSVVICAEVSLFLTYIYLLKDDWAWWWKSFFASGCVAINIFFYSLLYLYFDLKSLSDPVLATKLVILWLGYSLFMALEIMMAMGTVGFFSSFWFVYYFYDAYMLEQMKSYDGSISV